MINLLPGNQLKERKHVESLGMTYTQIPVEWTNPTMDNLDAFVRKMKELQGSKIYVHCAANMRASAFIFVYRVTQLGIDKKTARAHMDSVWFPTKQWNTFIRNGLTKYGAGPEWRLYSQGVEFIRTNGTQAFLSMKRSIAYKIEEKELLNLADATLAEDADTAKAIDLYRLCMDFFPDEEEGYLKLGSILREQPSQQLEAIKVYKELLRKKPNHLWAKRCLGQLKVDSYVPYWSGIDYPVASYESLVGTYDAKGHFEFTLSTSGSHLTFKTPWLNEPIKILKDPENNFFVTRWPWTFDLNPNSTRVTIHYPEGVITGERK